MTDKNHKDVLNNEYLEGTFHMLTGHTPRRACSVIAEPRAMILRCRTCFASASGDEGGRAQGKRR
jgi:hypothetical protein